MTFQSIDQNYMNPLSKRLYEFSASYAGYWSGGGLTYVYVFYEAVEWTKIFPTPNELCTAIWLMTISLRFVALWMPMGFLLIYWRMKRMIVLITFIGGGAVALILCIIAISIIQDYRVDNYLRDQYINLIKADLEKGFPTIIADVLESENCCSWYGPTDFGETFNIDNKKDTDLQFMKIVAKCMGNSFTVEQTEAGLHYAAATTSKKNMPQDCGRLYKITANRICNCITYLSLIVCILAILLNILYVLNYKRIETPVSPLPIDNSIPPLKETKETDNVDSESENQLLNDTLVDYK